MCQASGEDNYIFTQVMYRHYSAPPGFNFDWWSHDEPIHDNKNLEYYNIEKRATDFVNYFR